MREMHLISSSAKDAKVREELNCIGNRLTGKYLQMLLNYAITIESKQIAASAKSDNPPTRKVFHEVELTYPQTLEPECDCIAEKIVLKYEHGVPHMVVPDKSYERGWDVTHTAFYFPVASKPEEKDLERVLRALNLWDTLNGRLDSMRFRSGVLFKYPDDYTLEQLEELRRAAFILLWGYRRFYESRQEYVLQHLGSTVALLSEYSSIFLKLMRELYPSQNIGGIYNEEFINQLWERITFSKRYIKNVDFLNALTGGSVWYAPLLEY